MNQKIRKYLIDQCVKGRPIFYEDIGVKLNLNLALDKDRMVLSKTLGEISAFEHSKGRPLISSIAIYKQSNDHGNGFYNLCEELGIGKSSDLKKDFFGFTQLEESKRFWKDDFNFSRFYELNVPIYDDLKNPFINKEEIDFFKKWKDRVYDKNNQDHISSKNYILDTVWNKTKFWSNEVINRLENYETSNKRMWSKRDWNNGKRVSTFKPYTWARIFKIGDKSKNIFFTIGIDTNSNALIYKLDYYRENDSTLNSEQKKLCEKHIPESLKWNTIPVSEIENWDWESLIKKTTEFIVQNTHHYDQLIKLVWGKDEPKKAFNNSITLREYPKGGLIELPKLKPNFKGHKTDYFKRNEENKSLGDAGEELVKDFERNKLIERNKKNLSEKITIVEDGKGYDVLSFDENDNEVFIEVKTTKGNEKTPFYLSLNEKLFCEANQDKYIIYRLYNYDEDNNTADYFKIENPLNELLFQPTEYKIYLKKQ